MASATQTLKRTCFIAYADSILQHKKDKSRARTKNNSISAIRYIVHCIAFFSKRCLLWSWKKLPTRNMFTSAILIHIYLCKINTKDFDDRMKEFTSAVFLKQVSLSTMSAAVFFYKSAFDFTISLMCFCKGSP